MSESERANARRTETIPQWKRDEVDDLETFLDRYESVGIVDVAGIPSRQLQSMRRDLHGQAELRMSRNTLVRRALEGIDEGLEELVGYVSGQVGLIGTNDNPFGLYRQLEASKTPAPINAGEVAPNDIVIPEGDTGVDPGPFVGELQSVGAEARIMEGSIQVTADSVVCEAGEEVSAELADVLGELGIEPKEVGLDLRAVHSEGVLFEPAELDIDVGAYRDDVEAGAAAARNLSINAAYPTARTAGSLLGKAAGEAKAVGLFAGIEDPDVLPDLVARADAQVRTLAGAIDDEEALPEDLRGVEAPAAGDGAEKAKEAASDADETDEDQDAQADDQPTGAEAEEAGDDDDDDDAGAEGLGEMFG